MQCVICNRLRMVPYADEIGGAKNGFTFDKCYACGYVVASPLPSQAELDELYGADHFRSSYHPQEAENEQLFEQRQVQYVQDRDLLLEFMSGGRLLDFGCGNGHFLGVFSAHFRKYGYELNRVTTDYLHAHADFSVVDTLTALEGFEDGYFDGVMMRGVIEHLIDPEAAVSLLSRKLKADGVLFICATPNADSPCALVYGAQWNQFTPPYHLHFFSPRTLGLLAARHDLALIECRFPYLGTPYESEQSDSGCFVRDAQSFLDGGSVESSPPFPGTMMSLVFRKVG